MLKVYCYSRCTTCKKALKWLDDHNIAYEVIDIKTEHPNETVLAVGENRHFESSENRQFQFN